MRHIRSTLAVLIAASLYGCANPMLTLDVPGSRLSRSPAPTTEPASMAEAVQKLNYVRATYYEAIVDQTAVTQNSTIGLVWLGTAIAGMAAGKVHRDAIVGASLLGGTAYAIARTQLDARRIQVWMEGIKALDCAREASLPVDLGDSERKELERARTQLVTEIDRVQQARDNVGRRLAVGELSKVPDDTKSARKLADAADVAIAKARSTADSAQELLRASRGLELSLTVSKVSLKVTEVMSTITLDPASVKQMIAGIGGFAAIFAPGAGIEATVQSALGSYAADSTKAGPHGANPDLIALDHAAQTLAAELALLAPRQARVAGMIGSVDVPAVNAALKKCDVAGVLQPLTFSPQSLEFVGASAATKGFVISGGTPPYEVTALDDLPDGSSIAFKGGALGDSVQVKVPANAAAGDYRLRVLDASSAKQSQQMVVRIGAKDAGGGGGGAAAATPAKADVDKAWTDYAAALKAYRLDDFHGVNFTVVSATHKGGKIAVKLKCVPAKAALAATDVRAKLLTVGGDAIKTLQQANQIDKDGSQIDLSPSSQCVTK